MPSARPGTIEAVGHLITGPGDDLVGESFGKVQDLVAVFDERPKAVDSLRRVGESSGIRDGRRYQRNAPSQLRISFFRNVRRDNAMATPLEERVGRFIGL